MIKHTDKFRNDFQNLLYWLELRREQGADVEGVVRELHRTIRQSRTQVIRAKPASRVTQREPDALKQIRALRPKGPRVLSNEFNVKDYQRRLKGALMARAAGCTLGAIVELWTIEQMEHAARAEGSDFPPTDYWKTTPDPERLRYGLSPRGDFVRSKLRHVPVDDDVTYTLLGLLVLERYGADFTTKDIGKAWLAHVQQACTAEREALHNLRNGAEGARAALKNNPFVQWIGADIRADPWGYAAPGLPEKAAEMAYRDAMLTHRQNGVYGSMLFAAAIAAAFVVDDPLEAIRIGLTEIPKRCALSDAVHWALDQADEVKDFRHARALVDERFPGMDPVHTINNAALTVFGLKLGDGDLTRTIGHTVAMGLDNDCTAATAGSILGAIVGIDEVPPHWYRPFRGRIRTYLKKHEWFTVTDTVRRFTAVARDAVGAA